MEPIINGYKATRAAIAAIPSIRLNASKKASGPGKRRSKSAPEKIPIVALPEFLIEAKSPKKSRKLSPADRNLILDQAILLFDQFYAHLPFKRARYSIDPVRKLRLLKGQWAQKNDGDDIQFHMQVMEAFAEARDPHTFYSLPAPFRGAFAFLPFFVSYFTDELGGKRFFVTSLLIGFTHPTFGFVSEIISWNGIPIEEAVKMLAEKISGGNEDAKFFRGMMRLTSRSLGSTPLPDEHSVFVEYIPIGDKRSPDQRDPTKPPPATLIIRLPWYVAKSGLGLQNFQTRDAGICQPLDDLAVAQTKLWADLNQGMRLVKNAHFTGELSFKTLAQKLKRPDLYSTRPDVFSFQVSSGVAASGNILPQRLCLPDEGAIGNFGYIRIKTFRAASTEETETLVQEFQRILELIKSRAVDGLILDIRTNPGGSISFAERLLQMLTPGKITPARFHLPNTTAIQSILQQVLELRTAVNTQAIGNTVNNFLPWVADAADAVASGSLLTAGQTLTDFEEANQIGQIYQSPVVLLIDAGAYSATDIFAAGFKDHQIGEVIGVDRNTGGGGASRWLHSEDLVPNTKALKNTGITLLPAGCNMGVALLRSSRVGESNGQFPEDVGVLCDHHIPLTALDLQEESANLLERACSILAKKRSYQLEIKPGRKFAAGKVIVKLKTKNIDRIACFVDDSPILVVDGSATSLTIPFDGLPKPFILKGYNKQTMELPDHTKVFDFLKHVASCTVTRNTP